MKSFLLKILTHTALLLAFSYLIYFTGIHKFLLPGWAVYQAEKLSKTKSDKENIKLFIGDSVAKQLLDTIASDHTNYISLACNQAVDMIGQYLLLNNFLSVNKSVDKVYIIYNPFSFKNDLDHQYIYNNFLKVFYNDEYSENFTEYTKEQIDKIPLSWLANFSPINVTFYTPVIKNSTRNEVFLSRTSKDYLDKTLQLLQQHNIEAVLSTAPIKESRRDEVESLKAIYENDNYRNQLLDDYFEKIVYFPDSLYRDNVHFNREHLPQVRGFFSTYIEDQL